VGRVSRTGGGESIVRREGVGGEREGHSCGQGGLGMRESGLWSRDSYFGVCVSRSGGSSGVGRGSLGGFVGWVGSRCRVFVGGRLGGS